MSMVSIPGKSGLGSRSESTTKNSLGPEKLSHEGDYRAIDLPPAEDRTVLCEAPVFEEVKALHDTRSRYSNGARLLVAAGEPVKISYVQLTEKGYALHGMLFSSDGSSQMKSIYHPEIAYIGVERSRNGQDEYRVGLMQSFKGLVTLQLKDQSFLLVSSENEASSGQVTTKKEA